MREERKRDDKMYKKRQRQSKTEEERGAESIKRKSGREGETEEQREAGDKQIVCVGLLEMFFQKVHYAKEIPQGSFNKSLLDVWLVKYFCGFYT